MSKELSPLEMWEKVKEYIEFCTGVRDGCEAIAWTSTYYFLKPFMDGIEAKLKEYEETDNQLNKLFDELGIESKEDLIKKLKALKIIKEKRVNVQALFYSTNCEDYNKHYTHYEDLTQEEYDLLKEVLL